MTLNIEIEKTLGALYELLDATVSEISKQLGFDDHRKENKIVREELDMLCEMGYAVLCNESDDLYKITSKGIAYFQT